MNPRYFQVSLGHSIEPSNRLRSKRERLKFLVNLEKKYVWFFIGFFL